MQIPWSSHWIICLLRFCVRSPHFCLPNAILPLASLLCSPLSWATPLNVWHLNNRHTNWVATLSLYSVDIAGGDAAECSCESNGFHSMDLCASLVFVYGLFASSERCITTVSKSNTPSLKPYPFTRTNFDIIPTLCYSLSGKHVFRVNMIRFIEPIF